VTKQTLKGIEIMLVLSRMKGERILIGDDIEIIVNHVKGDRVSLGITAPKETRILRREVAERDRKNLPAA
jgi:carbon storage regulator